MSQQGNSLADYQLTDPLGHSGGPREVSTLLLLHLFTYRPSDSRANFSRSRHRNSTKRRFAVCSMYYLYLHRKILVLNSSMVLDY
ncbi:hypothetical protein RchiOBHm_Chr1g0348011 [Rosa chinensis]|uniref:Uncharacterized protein n=1 Tax=Rosa chinensis TaxID=74649 RepID=A0A2P6SFF2_ROSCH|nr:hypothetical protein RchiOBHm_Chr1g0348011 [Rosa chinensis]